MARRVGPVGAQGTGAGLWFDGALLRLLVVPQSADDHCRFVNQVIDYGFRLALHLQNGRGVSRPNYVANTARYSDPQRSPERARERRPTLWRRRCWLRFYNLFRRGTLSFVEIVQCLVDQTHAEARTVGAKESRAKSRATLRPLRVQSSVSSTPRATCHSVTVVSPRLYANSNAL